MHLVTTILVPILLVIIHLEPGPINFLKQGPTGKSSGFPADQSAPVGVTFSRKFSVSQHVNELLTAYSQSLFAL